MSLFNQYIERYRREEQEYSLEEFLAICKNDSMAYASSAERMLAAPSANRNWSIPGRTRVAFQIRDDLIDLTHGKGRGGVIGSDVKEGKASFLYSYALQVACAEDKKHLREIMLKPRDETTDADIQWVLGVYNNYGAIKHAQAYAEDLVKQAYKTIDEIPVENRAIFKEIASFMAQRMS